MNILVLPLISSLVLLFLYRSSMSKIHPLTIVISIIGLGGSLAWAFIYSGWDDTLLVSGVIFTAGFFISLGFNPNKAFKKVGIANLINRTTFLLTSIICYSSVFAADIPGFRYFADEIMTAVILITLAIVSLLIWRKLKNK